MDTQDRFVRTFRRRIAEHQRLEKRIVRAAMRAHYWYMQPIDNDAVNGAKYAQAIGDMVVACDKLRKLSGKRPANKRTALARLEIERT